MNIIVNKYDRAVVYSSILLPILYFKLLKLSDVMLSSRENPTFCIHKLNSSIPYKSASVEVSCYHINCVIVRKSYFMHG